MRNFLLLCLCFIAYGSTLNAQCGITFNEPFDAGPLPSYWTIQDPTSNYTYNSSIKVSGANSLEIEGGIRNHFQGIKAEFAPVQASRITWYARVGLDSTFAAIIMFDDTSTSSNVGIHYSWFNTSGKIYQPYVSSNEQVTYSPNTWYLCEMRNIDWVARKYEYWIDNVMIDSSVNFTSSQDSMVSGVYLYNYDTTSLSYFDEIRVYEGEALSVSLNADNISCNGQTDGAIVATTNTANPVSYLWSNGATTQNVGNLGPGSYSVTVSSSGCVDSSTISISEPSALNTAINTASDPQCADVDNGLIILSVSGGTPSYTYNWSNGATTQNVSGLSGGLYSVTIEDARGCTQTETATLNTPPQINVSGSIQGVGCSGANTGSITLSGSGGTGTLSYAWSTGQSGQSLSNLGSGSYTCTVTDQQGCSLIWTDSIPAAVPISQQANVGPATCHDSPDGAIILNPQGGTPPYTYFWSNFSQNENQSNLVPGWYYVWITDDNGCSHQDSVEVTGPAPVDPNATITDATGGQANGVISLNPTGGTPGYSYQWDLNAGGGTFPTIAGLATGTYEVTITDNAGCTSVHSFLVDGTTAIEEGELFQVALYPNPAQHSVRVSLPQLLPGSLQIEVFDLRGKVLLRQEYGEQSGDFLEEIDLNGLAQGVYFFKITHGVQTVTQRLVKE